MSANSNDLERMIFFEQAREQAAKDFKADPQNAQALTRWGGALLELASFRQGEEAAEMIDEAVNKFKVALSIESNRHDTMWCLGNAYTSQGFLTTNESVAHGKFAEAKTCFTTALELRPENDVYRKAVEMTDRAPELYQEIQKSLQQQQSASHSGGQVAETSTEGVCDWLKNVNEHSWDMAGWVTFTALAAGVFAMLAATSRNMPPPTPSR